jgi:hypothetical protein
VWQIAATYSLSISDLSLSTGDEAIVRRRGVSAALERRLGDDWTVQASAGASLGGDLTVNDERYDFAPGWEASLGASYRILDGTGLEPFLVAALTAAVGSAKTTRGPEEASFTALDARLSLLVGKLFWKSVAPYAVARVFGGPVFWSQHEESLTGTDKYHVQLGLGLLAAANGRMGAFFEIVPLGERAVSFGANVSF